MGIDVALTNETHEKQAVVLDPSGHMTILMLEAHRDSSSICLRFVDPWGDTIFNPLQIPHLLDELKRFENQVRDEQQSRHLADVIRLVESAVDQVHTYVRFIGD